MFALTDYTIDEAFRRGVPIAGIKQMIALLQRYGVESFDVSLKYLRKHRNSFAGSSLAHLIRCRIKPDPAQLALARSMGFSKIAVVWCNKRKHLSLFKLAAVLKNIQDHGGESYLVIEDAADCFYTEFHACWPLVESWNVRRVVYCDDKGDLDPFMVRRNLTELLQKATCPLEFRAGNGFGLATANSLAALKAGVECVGTAVNGVGLQGRAAMEELLMAVRHLWNLQQGAAGHTLADDCAAILAPMNIQVQPNKAIIGRNVFAHESGIHVDGISKNPALYEIIRPEEVGLTRQLVIGKHSGTASLRHKLHQWNLDINQSMAVMLLEQVRELAELQKSPLSDSQLMELYKGLEGSG